MVQKAPACTIQTQAEAVCELFGVNVLVARYYGANQECEVKDTVHTAITLSVVCGVFLSIIGIILAKPLLTLMDTPADVIDLAALYMRVYFAGMPVMLLYNFASSVSDRLVEFAKGLAGNDTAFADELLAAMKKGFEQATGEWGDKLPDICQRTMEAAEKKMIAWRDGKENVQE